MNEITITHRETITKEDGRIVVFNEWLYDGLPVHIAPWFDDHHIKARNVELSIFDNVPVPEEGQRFTGPPDMFIIYSENGYWIDRVVRKEKVTNDHCRLIAPESEPVEVTEFVIKLDNKAIHSLGITEPIYHEDGRELWKQAIPLLEYIENKKGE